MNFFSKLYHQISTEIKLYLIQKQAIWFSNHHHCASSTINGAGQLYKRKSALSQLPPQELEKTIAKVTKLQPEPGLIYGTTPKEKEQSIEDMAQTLIAGYKLSKKVGELNLFFDQAFESDPCFNARISQLRFFLMNRNPQHFPEGVFDEKTYEPHLAKLLLDLMYECSESATGVAADAPPTLDELISYLKNRPESSKDITDLIDPEPKPELIQLYLVVREGFV